MQALLQATGFFGAHAVWCVSDGEVLCPFVGVVAADGRRSIERFEHEDYAAAVELARQFLRSPASHYAHAILAFDGYVSLPEGRTDAVIVEAVSSPSSTATLRVTIPYRPASSEAGFAVHRPKFHVSAEQQADLPVMAEQFFAGVDGHEKASRVWNEHLDESR